MGSRNSDVSFFLWQYKKAIMKMNIIIPIIIKATVAPVEGPLLLLLSNAKSVK